MGQNVIDIILLKTNIIGQMMKHSLSKNKIAHFMENNFKEGEIVYAKIAPKLKLVVRRYVKRIYYCKVQNDPNRKDLVYFERELMPNTTPAGKK
jgi:hypothetical protein